MHLGQWLNKLKTVLPFVKKNLYILLASLGAIFAPVVPLLVVTGAMVTIDTFTGVWASRKRGEAFTSLGFGRIISKTLKYHLAILTGFMVEKYLIDGTFAVSKIVSGFAGITEFISILENIDSGSAKPIFGDLIKRILNRNSDVNKKD